jgi:hypothetical protein
MRNPRFHQLSGLLGSGVVLAVPIVAVVILGGSMLRGAPAPSDARVSIEALDSAPAFVLVHAETVASSADAIDLLNDWTYTQHNPPNNPGRGRGRGPGDDDDDGPQPRSPRGRDDDDDGPPGPPHDDDDDGPPGPPNGPPGPPHDDDDDGPPGPPNGRGRGR